MVELEPVWLELAVRLELELVIPELVRLELVMLDLFRLKLVMDESVRLECIPLECIPLECIPLESALVSFFGTVQTKWVQQATLSLLPAEGW